MCRTCRRKQKKEAYTADILYGTNNEFGFDYLRDNMAFRPEDRVQRERFFAVVDEVDSILIDEARTPLIISGPAEDSSELYTKINLLIPQLVKQDQEDSEEYRGEGHYTVDEKSKQAHLTENGQEFVEDLLKQNDMMAEDDTLYSPANISLLHHVNAALRAHVLFERDVDYIVKNDEVSSWMNILAVLCRDVVGLKVFTRRLKPKKALRSRMKTRRWHQSRSRTTSVCTANCQA